MVDQLKACPFCKSPATKRKKGGFLRRMFWYPGLTKVSCSNDGCGAFFSYWSAEEWNTRSEPVIVPTGDLSTTVQAGDERNAAIDECAAELDAMHGRLRGGQHNHFKFAAARLLALKSAAPSQPVVRWDLFPGWLIDHCEGEILTEELLQVALEDMINNHKENNSV